MSKSVSSRKNIPTTTFGSLERDTHSESSAPTIPTVTSTSIGSRKNRACSGTSACLRSVALGLYRRTWRHSRRAAGRQPRRAKTRDCQDRCGCREDTRIPRTDLEDERGQPASENQGARETGHDTRCQHETGLPQHESANLSAGRSEGHSDPDLPSAQSHRVRKHTVEADGGERQRHRGERARSTSANRSRPTPRPTTSVIGAARCTRVQDPCQRRRDGRRGAGSPANRRWRRPASAPSSGCGRTGDGRNRQRRKAFR